MKFQLPKTFAALALALTTAAWSGCDVHSTPNPQGGRTTVIETPTAPTDPRGVHVNIEPNGPFATPPGKGEVRVNVDPQTGVNVKVDGQPVREILKERRDEADRNITP
jgi:hypothetical protein